jgi:FKBP-type peptidyl-prolyl cis-trans isomerase FkpA
VNSTQQRERVNNFYMNSPMAVRIFSAICFSFLFVGLISCSEPPEAINYAQQLETEIAAIDAHLAATGQTAIKDPSGVRIVITKPGIHLPALHLDSIDVEYKGTLFSSGGEFDSGRATFYLNSGGLIAGWKIAFAKIPRGSEATLYIPSWYAYRDAAQNGATGKVGIPANSTLVFDVVMKDVIHSTGFINKFKSDTTKIEEYLEAKQITTLKDSTGVRYEFITPGAGVKPNFFNKVTLTYSFKILEDDTETLITINREPSETFNSFVVDYLSGMQAVLLNMPEGAKCRLYVPSGLGFAASGATDGFGQVIIPANANLIIDLELKDIQ